MVVHKLSERSANMLLPVINSFSKLESLEKLTYLGPQLTTSLLSTTFLTFLSITNRILFPLTMVSFGKWLSNLVQLDIFSTQRSLRYLEHPILFKLDHIKSFMTKSLVTENLPFITTLVSVNKSLTTLCLSLSYKDCDQLQNHLQSMTHIECFDLKLRDFSLTAKSSLKRFDNFYLSSIFQQVFSHLTSLRVYIF